MKIHHRRLRTDGEFERAAAVLNEEVAALAVRFLREVHIPDIVGQFTAAVHKQLTISAV